MMDFNISKKGTSGACHTRTNDQIVCKGFKPGQSHAFVVLSVVEGKFPNRQDFDIFMSPDAARDAIAKLKAALDNASQ